MFTGINICGLQSFTIFLEARVTNIKLWEVGGSIMTLSPHDSIVSHTGWQKARW